MNRPQSMTRSLPSTLITKENIDQYKPYPGPDGDWKAEFAAMWGKG